MATLSCNNKGCYKTTSDSLLDEQCGEVICSECGKPITNVSEFTKRSMVGLGKVSKKQSKASFCVECRKCKRRGQPIQKDGSFLCYYCNEKLELTRQFEKMFAEYLQNKGSL